MANNPFPGLRHFEQKETHLFFGRDGQSKELLKRLQDSRFLALVGVSGSGKSSLVRAGLLPALYGGLMSAVESDWRIAVFRPGNNPIGNMARALIKQAGFGAGGDRTDIEVAVAETTLRRGNLGLLELIRNAKKKVRNDGRPFLANNENVLIVVDQFEEIFRIIEQYDELVRVKNLSEDNPDLAGVGNGLDYHPREDASAFVKLLLESTRKNKEGQHDENIYIIVTMRSDYLGETAQFWGMPERINEGQYLIPRMNRDERRKAIVGPVAVAGGSISEPLVNQLLNDAGENPGHLPILQHALMRMWELAGPAAQNNGGLQLSHYDQIGKLSGALSQHANEAFAELSPEHQKLAAKVFKCLTEKGLANREIRRPMAIADICEVVGAKEAAVTSVIECFRKEGRWFLMPPPTAELQPDTLIDISHESLISGWDKLSLWVNEEAESARTYKRLADTAILKERDAEDFYRGPALQLALKWRQDNAPNAAWARRYHPEFDKAIAFLEDSKKDTERRQQDEKARVAKELRRRRTYNIILAVLVVMILAVGIFAVSLQQRMLASQKQLVVKAAIERDRAEANERSANESKLLAEKATHYAQLTAARLQQSLTETEAAVTAAKKAEAIAIAERKTAVRLQQENQEQTTISGYFQAAFGHVASQQYDDAVTSLKKALTHYKQKESKTLSDDQRKVNKQNIISTHINIADVYRSANDDDTDELAIEEYDAAIKLIDSNDSATMATTLKKAGSVWKNSESSTQARKAADYYENAAGYHHKLGQSMETANAFVEAGSIRARFFRNPGDFDEAFQDFQIAIQVLDGDEKLTAPVNEAIGEVYFKLVSEDADEDDDDERKPSAADDPPTRESATRKSEALARAEDRVREIGADFYRRAAIDYAGLKEQEKAAQMQRMVGTILSGSNATELLANAQAAFDVAATAYAGMGKLEEQKELLLKAGDLFAESKTSYGKSLADQFYDKVIALSGTDKQKKVNVLVEIAQSYARATDPSRRRKSVAYYEQIAALYREAGRKREQVGALLAAGTVLRDLNDEESTAETGRLWNEAIAVYQDNPKELAKTLRDIGNSYAASEQREKKEQAIAYYDQAATVARPVDKREEVNGLLDAGRTSMTLDGTQAQTDAAAFFERAIAVYENDVAQQTATITRIAFLYASAERPQKDRAFQQYRRAIDIAQQNKNRAAEVNAIFAMVRGIERLDPPDCEEQIETLYEKAVAVYNDDPAHQVDTLIRIGRSVFSLARDNASITKAERYFTKALTVAKAQPDKKLVASAHLDIGLGYQTPVSQRPKALQHYREALTIYETIGDKYGQATTLYRLIAVDRSGADSLADRSLPLFAEVLPTLQTAGREKELADAYYAIGSMSYRQKKDYKTALDNFTKALAIYKTLPDQTVRVSATNTQIRNVQRMLQGDSK